LKCLRGYTNKAGVSPSPKKRGSRGPHSPPQRFPVGIAYLNIHNFNIDYGIHVIKPWRRRIGTALLTKSLELAKFMDASNISVVRVFRSVKGTPPSDTRATKFYKANNPSIKLSIYRLNNDEK
jgi:hypothetical protein